MKKKALTNQHVALTTNGVAGACAAASVLMKYPYAGIRWTSPRHLPKALEALVAEDFRGSVHLCGVGLSVSESPFAGVLEALAEGAAIHWYSGAGHPEVLEHAEALKGVASLHCAAVQSDAEAVAAALGLKKSACALLIELAEEAARGQAPRSELHRFCHDLVQAANRRFFFFGDDTLNEQAIRYLAGMEDKSHALEEAVARYRNSPDALYPLGASPAMKQIRQQLGQLGPVPEPVLVLGPTGAGKELIARGLHITSGRAGAFVAVNCAVFAGNSDLVKDRLFGHVKGAFTGANRDAKGAFEEADGGTLFLDEVGELPAEAQAQLLRVLEEGEVRPVGAMKLRSVNVRIVAATHRDLGAMVAAGTFRQDLFYRLNVLMIHVPPLCERPEDMKSIAAHLAETLEKRGYPLTLSRKDWQALEAFDWPGNVRQFLNVLKRAAYRKCPVIEALKEEQEIRRKSTDVALRHLVHLYCPDSQEAVVPAQEVYAAYLRHVLDLFEGNITRTAAALEIAPNTLRKHVGLQGGN